MGNFESVHVDINNNDIHINVNGDSETLLTAIYFMCIAFGEGNNLTFNEVLETISDLDLDVYEA